MGEEFPAIVTRIGGKSRRLVLEKQWVRAVASGELERDTPIRYEANAKESLDCLARDCAELDAIFDELLGPEPVSIPVPAPAEPEPVAEVIPVFAPAVPVAEAAQWPLPAVTLPAVTRPMPSPFAADGNRFSALQDLLPIRQDANGNPTSLASSPALSPLVRYAVFEGRSGRAEYWQFVALVWGVVLVAAIIQNNAVFGLAGLFYLAVLVPYVAVSVRRLHDIGLSGWWMLLWAAISTLLWPVAILTTIAWMAIMAIPGKPVPNRFGPPPQ